MSDIKADQIEKLTSQLDEAKAEIKRLRENLAHAATIAETAWLTEPCGTLGDDDYGYKMCQTISNKISALQQKEKS